MDVRGEVRSLRDWIRVDDRWMIAASTTVGSRLWDVVYPPLLPSHVTVIETSFSNGGATQRSQERR